MSKKVLVSIMLILSIMLTLVFTGCDVKVTDTASSSVEATPTEAKVLTIGQVIYNMNQPYQQAHAKQAEAYCKEKGMKIVIIDGKSDAQIIANGIDDLISKKVDGIIVQPQDGASINSSVEAAQAAGIPIVTFFNKATTATNPHVRLAEDVTAFNMGVMVANKWLEFYPGTKIAIGVIDEPLAQYTHEVRAQKFVAGVKSVQATAVDYTYDGKGVRDVSYTVAEDLLQAHPDVNIVYGINADSTLGALAAFKAAGRGKATAGKPLTEFFASIDGTAGELSEMVDSTSPLKACMALSPKGNARVCIDTLLKIINGEYTIKQDITIDQPDTILDYWSKTTAELQAFLKDDYLSDVILVAK